MVDISKYRELVNDKRFSDINAGFDISLDELNPNLKPFQRVITRWALKRGRAALFEDTGLGKTIQLLEWAHQVCNHTKGRVLVLSPLCVAPQTVEEAFKFGIHSVEYARKQEDSVEDIVVTNYEILDAFDVSKFQGVVLDEAPLKNETGKRRQQIVDTFRNTPYRLTCTATPAPNDYMEIGNQAEFLGVMTMPEMLSMFFIHDGGDTSKWRLKGHGVELFWEWLATWSVVIEKPSDIGFSDDGYNLPPLNIIEQVVETEVKAEDGKLFSLPAKGLTETRKEKRSTVKERCLEVSKLVNQSSEQWVIWCDLNDESKELCRLIPDAKEVHGSQSIDVKEQTINDFRHGQLRVLVTKAKIAGYGSNWQHAHNMVHSSINYSFESFYQTVRREWRYGQTKEVNDYIFRTKNEINVMHELKEKEKKATEMRRAMVKHMAEIIKEKINSIEHQESEYKEGKFDGDDFTLYMGDCVEVMHEKISDNSIDYSIFSPPFSSLYTYSNSAFDMGNTNSHDSFFAQFSYCVKELYRILKPGRLLSFHCMNIPTTKQHDGFIGIRDFRGELIKMFVDSGFIYHSEVCIWKDPVTAMQRTKALGLLWKQIQKDSSMCRQGIPDYLVTMRKPGINEEHIAHTKEEFPVELWQRYASPVWFDIDQSDTLNRAEARENEDERHICPLQLGVIRRAISLWTNPRDVVFTPFLGIGSEVYTALKEGRQGIGIELKPKYFDVAVRNCNRATSQLDLFAPRKEFDNE